MEEESAEEPTERDSIEFLVSAPDLSRAEGSSCCDDDDDEENSRLVIDEGETSCGETAEPEPPLKESPEFSERSSSHSDEDLRNEGSEVSPVKSEDCYEAALAGLQEISNLCSTPRATEASC